MAVTINLLKIVLTVWQRHVISKYEYFYKYFLNISTNNLTHVLCICNHNFSAIENGMIKIFVIYYVTALIRKNSAAERTETLLDRDSWRVWSFPHLELSWVWNSTQNLKKFFNFWKILKNFEWFLQEPIFN